MLNELYILYCDIMKDVYLDESLKNIGEKFNYYYADEIKSNILSNNLIEIDIRGAFPSICNILFYNDTEFINNLNSKENKLEKNIFLTNYITEKNKNSEFNYLKLLNNYAKIIIFGYVFNNFDNVSILEYKKDSILFKGEKIKEKSMKFNELLKQNNIEFRTEFYDMYYRINTTSIFYKNKKIDTKGKLKNPPNFIVKIIESFLDSDYYDFDYKDEIMKIYSKKYFDILYKLSETNLIQEFYMFGENKYLYQNIKFNSLNKNYNPIFILNYFLYPLIFLTRNNRF